MKLPLSFYTRKNVTTIAKELLGKILVTQVEGKITRGMIIETEAYSYKEKGCHAFNGMTTRNEVMFAAGGVAYVYLCYGVHEMFNIVTNAKGKAEAVLIRELQPVEGEAIMMHRMKTHSSKKIMSGPGKLTKAMGIDRRLNKKNLGGNEVWIAEGVTVKSKNILCRTRIGIDYAGKDALLPWRFTAPSLRNSEF